LAAGQKSEPFYSLLGLSETELPREKCPLGYIVFKIQGLGPSSASNPFNNGYGYLFLSRGDPGMDEQQYRYLPEKNIL
jgi:hypothetical protein